MNRASHQRSWCRRPWSSCCARRRSRTAKSSSPGAPSSARRSSARPPSSSRATSSSSRPPARSGRGRSSGRRPRHLRRLEAVLGTDVAKSISLRQHESVAPCLRASSSAPSARPPASSSARSRASPRRSSARWWWPKPSAAPASTRPPSTNASWATSSRPASGQNPARQAALKGGLADHVAALTINKVCGSGLKAVMLADQAIRLGDIEIAVAGGMESMSNAPTCCLACARACGMGHGEVVDSMIHDGLWCAFEQCHMGQAGEFVAEQYKVESRGAGRLRRPKPSEGRGGRRAGAIRGRNTAGVDPATQGRAGRRRPRRVDPGRRDRRGARQLAAGVQEGRIRHGRQRARASTTARPRWSLTAEARARSLGLAPIARVVAQATSGLPPKTRC